MKRRGKSLTQGHSGVVKEGNSIAHSLSSSEMRAKKRGLYLSSNLHICLALSCCEVGSGWRATTTNAWHTDKDTTRTHTHTHSKHWSLEVVLLRIMVSDDHLQSTMTNFYLRVCSFSVKPRLWCILWYNNDYSRSLPHVWLIALSLALS